MPACDRCGHLFGAATWFCPGCHRFRGVPCAACGNRLEFRQAACPCGSTTPAPHGLLEWARSFRPGTRPEGPGVIPRRVHGAPVRRLYPVVIEDLLAADAARVIALAGPPDHVTPGPLPEGPWFGLLPQHVSRAHVTSTWRFENVDNAVWALWWIDAGDATRVGEVASAPEEAVF
jgi:hypothetical protein